MKEHPVVRARKPFGLFVDILDFQLVAMDGKPVCEGDKDLFIRLDSKGKLFVKSKDTGGLWQRIPCAPIQWHPAQKE